MIAPKTSEMANPWKIGSKRMIDAPITTAPVVSKIGVDMQTKSREKAKVYFCDELVY